METFLKTKIDLSNPPNHLSLKILEFFANDPNEKEKLEEMSAMTAEGLELYYEYIYREKRNISEILFDFSSIKIPLEHLIECLGL